MKAMKVFEIWLLRGQSFLLTVPREQNGQKEHPMSPSKRYATKQAKARERRRRTARERLQRDQPQAQRAIEALAQALQALGLPDNLVQEIEGRLRRQQKLLAKSLA